jgi:hypothetical protein
VLSRKKARFEEEGWVARGSRRSETPSKANKRIELNDRQGPILCGRDTSSHGKNPLEVPAKGFGMSGSKLIED